jgi:ABC-type cobalamin transport system ATPase subunit
VLDLNHLCAWQGLAVVMTSRFSNHALLLSSRMALAKQGVFAASGRPVGVMAEPAGDL